VTKVAIDIEHELIQDRRKHQITEERPSPFSLNQNVCNLGKRMPLQPQTEYLQMQRISNNFYSRTYYDEITMKNRLDLCMKIHIGFEQMTTKQDDIVYVSNRKYRCDRGLLYEIMEPLRLEEIHRQKSSQYP